MGVSKHPIPTRQMEVRLNSIAAGPSYESGFTGSRSAAAAAVPPRLQPAALRIQPHQLGAQLPQLCGLVRLPRLLRRLNRRELVASQPGDIVVVVDATRLLELGRGGHEHQAVARAIHGLRHVEDVVHRKVKDLHEERLLVAEEAGPGDEPRAKAVHLHLGAPLIQAPLELPREQDVAELGVLVGLVGIIGAAIDHLESRPLLSHAAQVAQGGAHPHAASRARGVVHL
mmetsp:Transcript_21168/g.53260  ORF Transcript_21168/g.53260 Transcript_21168/m.53260 type:complete len:228 (+) Transcript_21168:78-761(+)